MGVFLCKKRNAPICLLYQGYLVKFCWLFQEGSLKIFFIHISRVNTKDHQHLTGILHCSPKIINQNLSNVKKKICFSFATTYIVNIFFNFVSMSMFSICCMPWCQLKNSLQMVGVFHPTIYRQFIISWKIDISKHN